MNAATPDSFDSTDGRTYSAVTAATPGQARFTWDYRQPAPMDEIATAVRELSGGTVTMTMPETGSDEYELVIAAQDAQPASELTAERDDYAARLKATDQSWAQVAAQRDQARADRNRARNVVAEMAAHWQRIGSTREEDELIAQWLKIAGLTS